MALTAVLNFVPAGVPLVESALARWETTGITDILGTQNDGVLLINGGGGPNDTEDYSGPAAVLPFDDIRTILAGVQNGADGQFSSSNQRYEVASNFHGTGTSVIWLGKQGNTLLIASNGVAPNDLTLRRSEIVISGSQDVIDASTLETDRLPFVIRHAEDPRTVSIGNAEALLWRSVLYTHVPGSALSHQPGKVIVNGAKHFLAEGVKEPKSFKGFASQPDPNVTYQVGDAVVLNAAGTGAWAGYPIHSMAYRTAYDWENVQVDVGFNALNENDGIFWHKNAAGVFIQGTGDVNVSNFSIKPRQQAGALFLAVESIIDRPPPTGTTEAYWLVGPNPPTGIANSINAQRNRIAYRAEGSSTIQYTIAAEGTEVTVKDRNGEKWNYVRLGTGQALTWQRTGFNVEFLGDETFILDPSAAGWGAFGTELLTPVSYTLPSNTTEFEVEFTGGSIGGVINGQGADASLTGNPRLRTRLRILVGTTVVWDLDSTDTWQLGRGIAYSAEWIHPVNIPYWDSDQRYARGDLVRHANVTGRLRVFRATQDIDPGGQSPNTPRAPWTFEWRRPEPYFKKRFQLADYGSPGERLSVRAGLVYYHEDNADLIISWGSSVPRTRFPVSSHFDFGDITKSEFAAGVSQGREVTEDLQFRIAAYR